MRDKWETSVNSCAPHPEWETSVGEVGDKCTLMQPEEPSVGDKCGNKCGIQVEEKCKLMRPKAPRVGDKCGGQV